VLRALRGTSPAPAPVLPSNADGKRGDKPRGVPGALPGARAAAVAGPVRARALRGVSARGVTAASSPAVRGEGTRGDAPPVGAHINEDDEPEWPARPGDRERSEERMRDGGGGGQQTKLPHITACACGK